MAWDDVKRQKAVDMYKEANPTAETSVQIVKDIADEIGETPNGVRMVLSKAEVYIKAAAAAGSTSGKSTKEKSTTPKVSKEDKIAALATLISSAGMVPDNDILSKLTGKAADYFVTVLNGMGSGDDAE